MAFPSQARIAVMQTLSRSKLDATIRPMVKRRHANHMARPGIANTTRLAHACNSLNFRRQDDLRRWLVQNRLTESFEENGAPAGPAIEMKDGWAVDTTRSLPHLDRVLEDSEKIIARSSGVRRSEPGKYRSYFQDVWTPEELDRYPSFLDFATSSDLLAVVSRCLKSVPTLSATPPTGICFVESTAAFDDRPDSPHDSLFYQIDSCSLPNVYVLVRSRDANIENGPWPFLSRGISQRPRTALRYGTRQPRYRVGDDEVFSVADRREEIAFNHPRGTASFIESSGCFRFGSRNFIRPRLQLMLGYTVACRTDFSEALLPRRVYPVRDTDSRLRKTVPHKNDML